ncbi:phosphoglycerate dehydrogenase [Bacteroidota bacterium]
MFKIQTLNNISADGLQRFPLDKYEVASEITDPDAILLRSFKMHDMELSENLKAIGRAGAGVNNIPVDKCTEKGIVVFNTPGANANAVKELVITGLLMSSRKISDGINWAKTLIGDGDEVPKLVEKGKSSFVGPEIQGKTLGIIGLGAIGLLVANAADALGMKVIGFDPYISIDAAWAMSHRVKRAKGIDQLLGESDYISLHMPLSDDTKDYIDKNKFGMMKDGVRILNFARAGLVNEEGLMEALNTDKVACYVTDFPNESMLKEEKIISIPHLGASTPESETNCAVMAVDELREFLENGNIKNSVNFPEAELKKNGNGAYRLCIANKNIPKMVGQITTVLANEDINIADMLNRHYENIAYNIIDVDDEVTEAQLDKIKSIEGVVRVRLIKQ